MDNRIANDMISSGMIPSGEKNKEDLSRTQYGSAPSPNKLMDAYKSMYGNKEEVINEMSGMGMTPKKAPAPAVKKEVPPAPAVKKEPPKMPPKTFDSMKSQISDKDAKRERLKKIMADNESVDLLAAYRSIYEHHKKDADGNTIPHEDEEVNEGKIPAGLQAYLDKKKGKKEDKKEVKEENLDEVVVTGTLATLGKLGAMAGKLGAAAAKTGVKVGAKVGGKAGANMMKSVARNPMGAIDNINRVGYAAQTVGNMMPKPSVPSVTKKQSQSGMISADADLFDIVKGQLLDEGLSEEEIKDIMLTLTPDEILNEISAETALAASKARDVQAGKLKGPENTEKRAELRAKASQNYDRSVEKRKSGFVKNTASPQGPSRIPTSGM